MGKAPYSEPSFLLLKKKKFKISLCTVIFPKEIVWLCEFLDKVSLHSPDWPCTHDNLPALAFFMQELYVQSPTPRSPKCCKVLFAFLVGWLVSV